jgi:hypothetical protein
MATPISAPDVAIQPKTRKRLFLKWFIAITAILFAYLAWQWNAGLEQGQQLADAAVGRFHADLDEGNYEQIYLDADEHFRQGGKKEEFIKLLDAMHRKLGNTRRAIRIDVSANAGLTGTFITTRYSTNFENGQAAETFKWVKQNGLLILHEYNILSNALVLN